MPSPGGGGEQFVGEQIESFLEPTLGPWQALFSQLWLRGSVLSLLGSILAIAGIFVQKAAMHNIVFPTRAPTVKNMRRRDWPPSQDPKPPRWSELLCSPLYWSGMLLFLCHYPVTQLANSDVPETTVAPLSAAQLILNFVMAYGLLNERFTIEDLRATGVCIGGIVAAVIAMPRNMTVHVESFPTEELAKFCTSLLSNPGFAAYLLSWLALFTGCVLVLLSGAQDAIPLALPLLVALFTSQWHFMSQPAGKIFWSASKHPEVWDDPTTFYVIVSAAALLVASVCITSEGLRQLDCRFFVPATFVGTTIMAVVQRLFFFREWQLMSAFGIVCFACACLVSLWGVASVSRRPYNITGATSRVLEALGATPGNGPERDGGDVLLQHQGVIAILEDHHLRGPPAVKEAGGGGGESGTDSDADSADTEDDTDTQPLTGAAPEVLTLETPKTGAWACLRHFWRLVPLFWCMGGPVVVMVLYCLDHYFLCFFLISICIINNGWKYGLHIVLFSYVGQTKMKHYENADFRALHVAEKEQDGLQNSYSDAAPLWEDVTHFVIVPNYKEDLEILRLTLQTIGASGIAVSQIGIVLAMEAREAEAEQKANQLREEFASSFRYIIPTFHPPDLEGEVPGKSANTRWAADRLFEVEIPKLGLDLEDVVITVADADSEFHPEYFAALTYHFVHAEGGDRHLSIWQPPILHYKNYLTQPAIVRMASFFTCQKELACLADPMATRVPYSTYSISASLAHAVNGWDPDWISEDWHMGLKCLLCTAGRLKIEPIFLGVVNTTPEGEGTMATLKARWDQAKRHALGFSELVFFHDHLPRVLMAIDGGWARLRFLWRALFFYIEMVSTHATMATLIILGPINTWLIMHFVHHHSWEDLNSWTFLCNCTFQVVSTVCFLLLIFTNVLLFEGVRTRLTGGDDPQLSLMWRSRTLHFLFVAISSSPIVPIFFALGCCAEWIAAVKSACTHKFDYEVASKPSLSQNSTTGPKVGRNGAAVAPTRA